MLKKNLKNKPLVEAILELKWGLSLQAVQGSDAGHHYRLLLGRFSERVEKSYPFYEPLQTAQIPDEMIAHMVQHRFRIKEKSWPLIQIGPGIMTVNETDTYTWPDFKVHCETAVNYLHDAHPAKQNFKIQELILRYINAVELNEEEKNVFSFLQNKMGTVIQLPEVLFAEKTVKADPVVFNWQASFPCDEHGGLLTLRFALGKRGNKPVLVFETLVQASGEQMPQIPDGFSDWIDKAHDLAEDWFFKLIHGDLERRFSGE
ncbi:TIGR04255 family protein [Candidatus Electronema sp. PJ]|uniref:TIGR04255 family protein n=1 Tax=Candidatus Electronema sp. PJ TaxID=3401572 RepID=UPI003AA9D438